jgi:hypothetical protein
MNTLAKRDSLPAVTAAAVVAIIFSLIGALGGLLGGISLLLLPQLPTTSDAPPMQQGLRAMSAAVLLFMVALAVFGIFVGIGILRRRNWARITILVWAGIMATISAISIPAVFLVFSSLPSTLANGEDAVPIMGFVKLFMVFFYGIPLGVGIWWLVLFTRPRVAAAFAIPAPVEQYSPTIDSSGFPLAQPSTAAPLAVKVKASCPLPLMIFAGFLIFSSAFMLLAALFPMTGAMPFFFFGLVLSGFFAKVTFAAIGLVFGLAGIAILKLKPWALDAVLVLQSAFLVNGILSLLNPRFLATAQEVMRRADAMNPSFPGGNPFLTGPLFHTIMAFGLCFSAAIIAPLIFYRSRFVEAASAAKI